MPLNPLYVVPPGTYQQGGIAPLLRCGEAQQMWLNQAITAGTTRSIAVQVEWGKFGFFYVPKLTAQLVISGSPGTFEIDVEMSESDNGLGDYVPSGTTITSATNTSGSLYVARWDLPANVFPKFVRLFGKTWPNVVTVSANFYH